MWNCRLSGCLDIVCSYGFPPDWIDIQLMKTAAYFAKQMPSQELYFEY